MRNIQAKQGGESKSIQAVWRHKAWIWQNYLEKAGSLSGLDWLGSTFELGCCTLATESGIQYTVVYSMHPEQLLLGEKNPGFLTHRNHSKLQTSVKSDETHHYSLIKSRAVTWSRRKAFLANTEERIPDPAQSVLYLTCCTFPLLRSVHNLLGFRFSFHHVHVVANNTLCLSSCFNHFRRILGHTGGCVYCCIYYGPLLETGRTTPTN